MPDERRDSGLAGAVAVVTGAGGGLGAAVADAFAAAGATPVLLDLGAEALDGVASRIEARHGARPLTLVVDVGDADQVERAAAEVETALGGTGVLVNNAAIYQRAPLADHPVDLWDRTLAVNLRGYFLCTVAFGRSMLAAGAGSIVNISSIAARGPTPNAAAYCVSKAGVLALTRQTAVEWGARGVRANSVSPGFLNTSMASVSYDGDHELTRLRQERVPVGRIGEPADVADLVVFLAGSGSSYISGEDMTIDGGLTQTLSQSFPRP